MDSFAPADIERPTRAEINLTHFKHNIETTKSFLKNGCEILGVIKADAYGHGIVRMAKELNKSGVNYLGVAFVEEGLLLREHGITSPILVLGAINKYQIADFIKHDLELSVPSIEKAKAIDEVAKTLGKKAVVHLKIDTGMERIGVHWYNADSFFKEIFALKNLEIKGVFSHFATSDSDLDFAKTQLTRFNEILKLLKEKFTLPPYQHIANSAAIISLPDSHFNLVRPGIMLYGYNPTKTLVSLKPVMSLKSKVSFFKVVPKDTGISYNHTYKTKTQTRIATIPIGYGDGYFRLLSNKGVVAIRGIKYPLVGNICMDQIMVDLGPDGEAYNGDDVLLFGEMGETTITLESLCDAIGTITYEFLCSIKNRVPRIYIK